MRNLKRYLVLSAAALLLAGCPYTAPDMSAYIPAPGTYDVEILRDTWGVPHIFGKTDADVGYGLAFAHCEDDFPTMQEGILGARGLMATRDRFAGIPFDYMVQVLGVWDTVEAGYDTLVSPEARALCEAYAAGVNHYAALHPDEITTPQAFPASGKDIVAGFVLKTPFFWGLDNQLRQIMEAKEPLPVSEKLAKAEVVDPIKDWMTKGQMTGSNCIAVGPSRSADGYTRLDVNSHQPWDGPVAWYEADLHSEEGWHTSGGVFVGSPTILHGFNEHLGWAHTVNQPDLADVYVLTINPENPNQYRFDGAWKDFTKRNIKLQIRAFGNIFVTVNREVKDSIHGPVFETPHGSYAIRIAGKGDVRLVDQYLKMNKATNREEFQAALEMRALPSFNVCYADEKGNIWYVYNANFPMRKPGWDYRKVLPGDTSETLWTELAPFSALPQVLNPKSGFVQNCNNDPFFTTAPEDNLKREDFPAEWGIDTMMTNRSLRALELFGGDTSITRQEFRDYKFDWSYSKEGPLKDLLEELYSKYPTGDALADEAINQMHDWDWSTRPDNTQTAIAVLTAEPIIRARMFHRPEPDLITTLTKSAHMLKEKFGRIDVPWGEVNEMHRGDEVLSFGGGPDVLYAVYGNVDEATGKVVGWGGEGYVALVEWSPEGKMSAQTVHHYGSAIARPDSPHYADQAHLFQQRKTKPAWFTREDIEAHLEVAYRPGEAWDRTAGKPGTLDE